VSVQDDEKARAIGALLHVPACPPRAGEPVPVMFREFVAGRARRGDLG
jgi:hypothetical protein